MALAGEPDIGTAAELERASRRAEARVPSVVLDLRQLTLTDSCGVRVIADARTRAARGAPAGPPRWPLRGTATPGAERHGRAYRVGRVGRVGRVARQPADESTPSFLDAAPPVTQNVCVRDATKSPPHSAPLRRSLMAKVSAGSVESFGDSMTADAIGPIASRELPVVMYAAPASSTGRIPRSEQPRSYRPHQAQSQRGC